MKHEYHIVWFEDDEDFVTDSIGFFTTELRNLGFRLKLIHEEDIRGFDDLDFSDVDLILSDLNMDPESSDGHDDTGKTLIEKVRNKGILTEIFFYSEAAGNLEASVQDLSKNISHIQRLGIHAGRKGLEKKVISFIEASIHKLEDLNNMRGLVISQAIELENDIVQICSSLLPDPAIKDTETNDAYIALYKRLEKKVDCAACKRRNSDAESTSLSMDSLLQKKLLTAADKLFILKSYLKKLKSNCSPDQITVINRFLKHQSLEEDFIGSRNILAHASVEKVEKKQVLRSINGKNPDITHTKEWCSGIRRNFLEYADLLDELTTSLTSTE